MYLCLAKPELVTAALTGSQAEIKNAGPRFKGHAQAKTQIAIVLTAHMIMVSGIPKIGEPEKIRVLPDQIAVFHGSDAIRSRINALFVKPP